MEGKLIKLELVEGYRLNDSNDNIIGSTLDGGKHKLSLTNCQAIERGYDLDELAKKYCTHEPKNAKELRDVNLAKLGFIDGFQKALEIIGDKKFTEEDALEISWKLFRDNPNVNKFSDFKNVFDYYIQSLQQTEWDVVIEMEGPLVYPANLPRLGEERPAYRPKLDSEGRLILKRKK